MNLNKVYNFSTIFFVIFFTSALIVNLLQGNKGWAIFDLAFIVYNAYQINYRLNILTDVAEAAKAAELEKENSNGN